ncbi:hypothetical protein DL89DRAFT_101925 [Linderina pennispora]|uniref:Uncharacterized protein n=1 Tax=Linderina pennispora TaxID=61395 RepID=A0A1Y1WEC1_9FUNG|nr:uncharacterized protein DL89DRAFT_101925 [Linderina pennispora]ORX71822.1 hypothetical protein DL89DRAFT_101925 [Linderina pennispora]
MICYSSPHPSIHQGAHPRPVQDIQPRLSSDSKPSYDNRYRLKFALLLSWCCRAWKDALPEKAVDTVTFEHSPHWPMQRCWEPWHRSGGPTSTSSSSSRLPCRPRSSSSSWTADASAGRLSGM